MRSLRSAVPAALLAGFLSLAPFALAQENPPPPPTSEPEAAAKTKQLEELAEVVKKQFGEGLEIALTQTDVTTRYLHPDKKKEAEWRYLLTGDLDADGVEDAVIVVRFKNPLGGQEGYNYKVVDPLFTFHGYGNPKVTAEFGSEDPRYHNMLLVIHGAGKEGWRAETPKAKFVIINLSFATLSLVPGSKKKKRGMAIMVEEPGVGTGSVFWDGKKYKWNEGGGSS